MHLTHSFPRHTLFQLVLPTGCAFFQGGKGLCTLSFCLKCTSYFRSHLRWNFLQKGFPESKRRAWGPFNMLNRHSVIDSFSKYLCQALYRLMTQNRTRQRTGLTELAFLSGKPSRIYILNFIWNWLKTSKNSTKEYPICFTQILFFFFSRFMCC